MPDRPPPELDMTIEGEFVAPPQPTLLTKIRLWAIVLAVLAACLAFAALALWLAMIILPVAALAAAVAWAIYRFQVWRAGASANRDLTRR